MEFFIVMCLWLFPDPPIPFAEQEGFVRIEAEHFHARQSDASRQWILMDGDTPRTSTDTDSLEYLTASGNAHLELLPDTRVTHDDPLIHGENFSNQPGTSVLEYQVSFETVGRYYVWVRAFSTGTEDNGLHVGLNGTWPDSGQRMQWCEGKHQWTWASKQRTQEVHCGEEQLIYLDIEDTGIHTIMFSMREDGFAFDAFVLTTTYEAPTD